MKIYGHRSGVAVIVGGFARPLPVRLFSFESSHRPMDNLLFSMLLAARINPQGLILRKVFCVVIPWLLNASGGFVRLFMKRLRHLWLTPRSQKRGEILDALDKKTLTRCKKLLRIELEENSSIHKTTYG